MASEVHSKLSQTSQLEVSIEINHCSILDVWLGYGNASGLLTIMQPTTAYSKVTMETLEQDVKWS